MSVLHIVAMILHSGFLTALSLLIVLPATYDLISFNFLLLSSPPTSNFSVNERLDFLSVSHPFSNTAYGIASIFFLV